MHNLQERIFKILSFFAQNKKAEIFASGLWKYQNVPAFPVQIAGLLHFPADAPQRNDAGYGV